LPAQDSPVPQAILLKIANFEPVMLWIQASKSEKCLLGTSHRAGQIFARPFLLISIQRVISFMQIMVRENNVDQALRALKKKLQREGVYREMKLRRHYEKPSEKRAREKAAAVRRARKMDRKRAERDGTTR
jgi:small subunit ribosomal protein S21